MCLRFQRLVVGPEPQILRWKIRINNLVGIQIVVGIQADLNFWKACINSGPNILGSNAPRDCPSPCSPESDPP